MKKKEKRQISTQLHMEFLRKHSIPIGKEQRIGEKKGFKNYNFTLCSERNKPNKTQGVEARIKNREIRKTNRPLKICCHF